MKQISKVHRPVSLLGVCCQKNLRNGFLAYFSTGLYKNCARKAMLEHMNFYPLLYWNSCTDNANNQVLCIYHSYYPTIMLIFLNYISSNKCLYLVWIWIWFEIWVDNTKLKAVFIRVHERKRLPDPKTRRSMVAFAQSKKCSKPFLCIYHLERRFGSRLLLIWKQAKGLFQSHMRVSLKWVHSNKIRMRQTGCWRFLTAVETDPKYDKCIVNLLSRRIALLFNNFKGMLIIRAFQGSRCCQCH